MSFELSQKPRCTVISYFVGNPVTGTYYLELFENYLFVQIKNDSDGFISQEDEAPSHWHLQVRKFLNDNYPQLWIDHAGN